MNVKVISFGGPEAGRKFSESLRETGFAVIQDHRLAVELIQRTFREWAAFFDSEAKHRYRYDPSRQCGYFPFRSENAKDYAKKDLKEFFHYYPWSELPSETRAYTPDLFRGLTDMGAQMLAWLDESTPRSVSSQFSMPLKEMIEGSSETLLRPIHYPPLTGGEEEGAVRAAAHEDINLITLLPAATAPGLEVKDTAGHWHEVACDPGTIVVNSGDMLREASHGYYPSTTHRVVNPRGEESRKPRYSMPLFLHARSDVRLSERYTAGAYLQERLREIGLK